MNTKFRKKFNMPAKPNLNKSKDKLNKKNPVQEKMLKPSSKQ